MAGYVSIPYRNATQIANRLMHLIITESDDYRGIALLAKEWCNIEQMKREWRGIPRLSHHTMAEVLAAKRANAKQIDIQSSSTPFDLESKPVTDHKESIIPHTVPTPPTTDAP